MNKRVGIAIFWMAVFALLLTGIHYFESSNPRTIESAIVFPIMSTQASLRFTGKDDAEIEKAFSVAKKSMERVVELCNYFDPKSELSRLNASAAKRPFVCSPELWEILTEARKFHRISNGAFDPTIRPLMNLWGFHRKRKTIPTEDEIETTQKICGWDKIRFNAAARSVFFPVSGMSIDLGGIAKGWAVDKAADAVLNGTEIREGIIDLGGNMRCLPNPPEGKNHYNIAVKDPKNPSEFCASVFLRNETVATSGSYERYVVIDGKQYTHIINPRTGRPVEGVLSATVVAPKGVDADALSTSLFINGPAFAEELNPQIRTLYIDAAGKVTERIVPGKEPFIRR